jgi:hypothetical protein
MPNVKLNKSQQNRLKAGQHVVTTETAGSKQVSIGPFQMNDDNWAIVDSGGTAMVLAEIMGANIMEETFVTI